MASEIKQAFVTLATNDDYAVGALVLAQSIRNHGTTADLVIMVTSGVSTQMRTTLSNLFTRIVDVDELNSGDDEVLALIRRPELGVTVTKINAWRLTEYSKCIFLDADCLLLNSVDELFSRPQLSAVCDLGWPDCFNSGVFVFQPEVRVYQELLQLLRSEGSFDGGDQGLLNAYFSDWFGTDVQKMLPFIYNMHATSTYSYAPALRKYGGQVKIVHFLGAAKPWLYNYNTTTGSVTSTFGDAHHMPHIQAWWNIFTQQIRATLSSELIRPNLRTQVETPKVDEQSSASSSESSQTAQSGLAGRLANLEIRPQVDDFERKKNWEAGSIDYMGVDSFENIQKKLDESIGK